MQRKKNPAIETFQYSPLILLKLTASHLGKECERLDDKAVIHPMLGGLYEKKKNDKTLSFQLHLEKGRKKKTHTVLRFFTCQQVRLHGLKHMTVPHPFWLQSASQPLFT